MRRVVGVLGVWMAFIPLAILNGVLRESVLAPALGARAALPISGVLLAGLILAAAWALLPTLGPLAPRARWMVGVVWSAMTVTFEFALGRLVLDTPWPTLVNAYNPSDGNLWVFVVATIAAAPALVGRARDRREKRS